LLSKVDPINGLPLYCSAAKEEKPLIELSQWPNPLGGENLEHTSLFLTGPHCALFKKGVPTEGSQMSDLTCPKGVKIMHPGSRSETE
jgi:hypothetical protein